ncbi:MAG: serine protease [Alphaproteobacteria bacterium]
MRVPDWVVYSVVLIVVVATLFARAGGGASDAPTAPLVAAARPIPIAPGPPLPGPEPFDEEVLVQVGEVENGIGTAFAINKSGVWLTARHVVDGCADIGLAIDNNRIAPILKVDISKTADLALLYTDRAPQALKLDLDHDLRIGDAGYHVGFPQGNSGEASSQLLARSRLVTHGRYTLDEPVLAWSETSRSPGIDGTLAGMSGGPVFDETGAVVGVTVAESARRGRIYSEAPDTIRGFLEEKGLVTPGEDARPLAAESYSREAERLRRDLAVVKVICRVEQK